MTSPFMSWERVVIRNGLLNVLRLTFVSALYLVTYPLLLHRLGPANFGLWGLLNLMFVYARVADLGMAAATVKFVGESAGSVPDRNRAFAVAFWVSCLQAAAVALLLLASCGPFMRFFSLSPELRPAVELSALAGGMALWGCFWVAALEGLQCMQWSNLLNSSTAVLNAAGTVCLILTKHGLVALMWLNLFSAAFTVIAGAFLIWKVAGWTPFTRPRPLEFAPFLKYGLHVQVGNLATLLGEPFAKFSVGRIISLAAVGYFDVGYRVAFFLRNLFTVAVTPLLPAVAEAQKADPKRTLRLYTRYLRWIAILALPAFIFLCMGAAPLLRLWLRNPAPEAVLTAQWMAIVTLISLLGVPAFIASQGIGRPSFSAVSMVISSSTIAIAGPFFLTYFGFVGILLSYLLAVVLSSAYVISRFHDRAGLSVQLLRPCFPPRMLAASLFLSFLLFLLFRECLWMGTALKLVALTVAMIVYLVLYVRWEGLGEFREILRSAVLPQEPYAP